MIRGLGNDIVEIRRIRRSIEKYGQRFLDKVFTSSEQSYCKRYADSAPHFSGRFCAKEAVAKALGTGFGRDLSFLDIEVYNDSSGKPCVQLIGSVDKHLKNPLFFLSISHSRDYATAVAVLVDQSI